MTAFSVSPPLPAGGAVGLGQQDRAGLLHARDDGCIFARNVALADARVQLADDPGCRKGVLDGKWQAMEGAEIFSVGLPLVRCGGLRQRVTGYDRHRVQARIDIFDAFQKGGCYFLARKGHGRG